MKAVRPALPATGILRCRLRSVLDVALATPAALTCRMPCLPAADCAGAGYKLHPDRANAFFIVTS